MREVSRTFKNKFDGETHISPRKDEKNKIINSISNKVVGNYSHSLVVWGNLQSLNRIS